MDIKSGTSEEDDNCKKHEDCGYAKSYCPADVGLDVNENSRREYQGSGTCAVVPVKIAI